MRYVVGLPVAHELSTYITQYILRPVRQLENLDFFVAGGALRDSFTGRQLRDLDVYPCATKDMVILGEALNDSGFVFSEAYISYGNRRVDVFVNSGFTQDSLLLPTVELIRPPLEFGNEWSQSAEEVIGGYEFTCNALAIYPLTGQMVFDETAPTDIRLRQLRTVVCGRDPLSIPLYRWEKMYKYGFKTFVDAGEAVSGVEGIIQVLREKTNANPPTQLG